MALPEPDIHVRLSPAMHAALQALAELEQVPPSRLARRVIEEYIMRRAHVAIVLADEFRRLGISGLPGESVGTGEKAGVE